MSSLYESYNYDASYRAVLSSNDVVKVFTEKDFIEVNSQISFDIEDSKIEEINDTYILEGKIKIKLKNPLTVLAVKGYSEEAKIDSCDITVYLFSDLEDDELIEFCKKSLNSCFIYNTLKDIMDINIKFIPIL